ncbi:MAG: outer membrane protein assembly factor BamB [Gammaproteobacteria bacterium RBG_16_51_14]|nr:MAG: outer membrane protein assembly factor BamB [Gammaproteobacteria bacterium RBG_16_51_14]
MRQLSAKAITLLFLGSLLCGCGINKKISDYMGDEDNTEPPSPLVEIAASVNITEVWSKNTGKGTAKQFLKLIPALSQQKIFIADSKGMVNAIDAVNGSTVWGHDTDLHITGGPGIGATLVLAGTSEGDVLALSPETGAEIWRAVVSSEILSSPREAGGIVIVRTIDGKIFALDANDGKRLWVYDRTVPALTLRGTSSPIIADDMVIAGFDEGRIAVMELTTGKLVWETKVAVAGGRSELERMVDIDAEPLVADGIIYVATYQGKLAAVALSSGDILWTRDISSYAGISVDSSNLYITDDNSHVWALERQTGVSVWKQEKLAARAATGPANIGAFVVVGDLEGYLHWMDKNTGEFVARIQVADEKIITPPIVTDNILYAYTSGGTLGAYTVP